MAAIIDHLRHHHHQQQHKKTTACEIMLWPFFAAHPIIALSMWINWSRQATQAHASLYADCGNTPNMRLWCKLSTPLVKDRFQYPVSDRLKKTVNAVFYFLLFEALKLKGRPVAALDFQILDVLLSATLFENYSKISHLKIVWHFSPQVFSRVKLQLLKSLIFYGNSEFATFVLIFVTQVFWRENHNF